MGKWRAIVAISLAQFVMVLDTTVMNVSLEQVVSDLGTTVANIQLAITFYTLTMAALMLTGGRVGGILGRLKAYRIGVVVYGIGSLITALSQDLAMLLVGWSFVEAIGAALIIPATMALVARNYTGRDRAIAYGILGGISAAGAAAGPLIGGFVTEYASWRYVFAAESVIMVGLLATAGVIKDAKATAEEKLDPWSVLLSAAGLGVLVFGILRSSSWGWITPSGNGPTLLGLSLSVYLIVLGIGLLAAFLRRQESLERQGRQPLLPSKLLKITQMRGGLMMLTVQQLVLAGTFFVIPVYLQIALGKGSLETGINILPLAIGVIIFSMIGARASGQFSPRTLVRAGLVLLFIGILILIESVGSGTDSGWFLIGMGFFGCGIGLGISQLGNTVMSASPARHTSEAGGLQGTATDLGMALGTALIGAVLLTGLNTTLQQTIEADPQISSQVKTEVRNSTEQVPVLTQQDAKAELAKSGLSESQQQEVLDDYNSSLIDAIKRAFTVSALISLIALWFVRFLPDKPLVGPEKARTTTKRRRVKAQS